MTAWFAPTKPEALKAQQLREAEMQLLQHEAHAEYHGAMAAMLHERIVRLRSPVRETIMMAGQAVYRDSPGLVPPKRPPQPTEVKSHD